eukprot:11468373-Prorocentrum_lima.AAC.1
MTSSLVGSEMCIRDSSLGGAPLLPLPVWFRHHRWRASWPSAPNCRPARACRLYTSDAADDM